MTMISQEPIAVVGLGCAFPDAFDPETFWSNIEAKKSSAVDIPAQRWSSSPQEMLSASNQVDKAYSRRACLVGEPPLRYDGLQIDPAEAAKLDPLYRLVLYAGVQALDSVCASAAINRKRTGVALAAIALPTDGASRLSRKVRLPSIYAKLQPGKPMVQKTLTAIEAQAARVVGYPAALLARALGLGAGSMTLDAACASSLYAIKIGCDQLRRGEVDAMLAGGVSRPDCLYTQVGFSQLRALSPSGICAPFDARADGLVVGEGAGVVVLKRLSDARSHQDTIHAVIRGLGISNDISGNLLAPDSKGQLRAMRSAYAQAGWTPQSVDLIECHGAGTPKGDVTEINSLQTLWQQVSASEKKCVLGSVKANVGHMLTAAGMAGLIKVIMAMRAGRLPATVHFESPSPGLLSEKGPFVVLPESSPWPIPGEHSRRAAVSAFGFGGINAHLLLEQWQDRKTAPEVEVVAETNREPVAIVGLAGTFGGAWTPASDLAHPFADARNNPSTDIVHRRWSGAHETLATLLNQKLSGQTLLRQYEVETGDFRIPPNELPDLLDQQLLMLKVAADAMHDAGMPTKRPRERMGAIIGIDFDFEATDFHLRWQMAQVLKNHADGKIPAAQMDQWLQHIAPPLNYTRTLGALGSITASRLAKEFMLGGTGFTVSCDAASGLKALEIGVHMLQAKELNQVLVGAVDLCGDARQIVCRRLPQTAMPPESNLGTEPPSPGEGAVALVLKTLSGATADGNRIYALIEGLGSAQATSTERPAALSDAHRRSFSQALQSGKVAESELDFMELSMAGAGARSADMENIGQSIQPLVHPLIWTGVHAAIGDTGAAGGLASLGSAAVALHRVRMPSSVIQRPGAVAQRGEPFASPRCVALGCVTADGNCLHVVLRSGDKTAPPKEKAIQSPPRKGSRPLVRRPGKTLPPLPEWVGPMQATDPPPAPTDAPVAETSASTSTMADASIGRLIHGERARMEAMSAAHERFLDFSRHIANGIHALYQHDTQIPAADSASVFQLPDPSPVAADPQLNPPLFARPACLEFARGSVAAVLGPMFAEVDHYPVRVRLPDEPLMLVDRILTVNATKGELGPGSLVTEHDVLADAWYLDGGRAPVCISVEAGQADLFLSAYMGIDLKVKGRRAYRLLDATVRFHRPLPQPGETIRYDIHIDKFIRQGRTHMFFFRFTGTIDGAPLITMTNGCAGFFTAEEVRDSGGIVMTEEERCIRPGARPDDWVELVAFNAPEQYSQAQLDGLRSGDLAAAFGPLFEDVPIAAGLLLPGKRMRLIHRILEIDPFGGRYRQGLIRAEADIDPQDWFLTCHFVDDMVMPGTLMYECCAHTLRVFLQRLGWFSDDPKAFYEPLRESAAVLKCRGPVTPQTRKVIYEVEIRQLGYGPEPYAIADANMYADGQHIVRFKDMSMQLSGVDRESLQSFWQAHAASTGNGPQPPHSLTDPNPESPQDVSAFDRDHILAYASGKPSRAFGPRYQIFDEKRVIARLPAPPYSFLDRIAYAEPPPWVLSPGGWVETHYQVPPDAWYFRAHRTETMPFCVLLEAALQACGWIATYAGSPLHAKEDLKFRNLDGAATLHAEVRPDAGRLVTRAKMTKVSKAAEMILESFVFEVWQADGLVYQGETTFGFFSANALANQVGLRSDDARLSADPSASTSDESRLPVDDFAPKTPQDPDGECPVGMALPSRALRMIDAVNLWQEKGGPDGLGQIHGIQTVDPDAWFFKAHFVQDPVCPGSLGIEALIELAKHVAQQRFPAYRKSHRFAPLCGQPHHWSYRGQVQTHNERIETAAVVTRAAETPRPQLTVDGRMFVDGLAIYEMKNFGIELVPVTDAVHPASHP